MITFESTVTVRDLVREAAQIHGENPYLRTVENGVFVDTSFRQFAEDCEGIAAWGAKKSREAGHKLKIATLSPNSCLYTTVVVGIMYGGCIAVPIDPQCKEEVLCACLNQAEVDILVLDDSISLNIEYIRSSCPTVTEIIALQDFDRIRKETGGTALLETTKEECAVILFTSGTTGVQKGVMLSNRNVTDSAMNSPHTTSNVKLNLLPLHHAFCLCADVMINFVNGSVTCYNGGANKVNENLLLFQPTLVNMVPRIAQALYSKIVLLSQQTGKFLMELKDEVYGARIQKIVAGGAHLPAELVEKYHAMGIFLCQGYGMTEYSPTIATPYMDRPDKAHTAGHVVKRCQTRTVDGELQVKGPAVMMGYVNAPELTAQVITEDGWLRTDDIGYEDEEGFIHITGRKKNLIILANGENVSPEQLENLLLDRPVIEECLVYGEGNTITAEVYPNAQYVKFNHITDIPAAIEEVVAEINEKQPSYKKIMKTLIRIVPFQKTGSNKIKRKQRATKEELLLTDKSEGKAPANELQQKLFDIMAGILGHNDFGVDTNIFTAGIDSLGSVLMMTDFSQKLDFNITLEELMNATTIEKLELLYKQKEKQEKTYYAPRTEYPLNVVQMYFAYIIKGNTTANIPVLFELDASVDLERLKQALVKLFDIHPILRNVVQLGQKGYANFRDDKRPVHIPIIKMDAACWEQEQKTLIKPYLYTEGEPLYHISLYEVTGKKYLLFDVAHIISDGSSLSILLDDMNHLYAGEEVEPESYTYYDFILDDLYSREKGLIQPNLNYFTQLLKDLRIDRSILNRKEKKDLSKGENATLWGRFESVSQNELNVFCQKTGVSENIFFLTAFNYCISLYSDKADTLCTSIHNGRTDSRWRRTAGCLFVTYNFRCIVEGDKSVAELLQANGKQVMETMCNKMNCMHADEMFIQYQGELLDFPQVAGAPAKKIPIQLDSLPFHLMVYCNGDGYIYELRYWENRFEKKQLELFMQTMNAVLKGMLTADKVSELYNYLPQMLFPTEDMPVVVSADGRRKPIGAWGRHSETNSIARILPDGSVDYLEDSGRKVLVESLTGRDYADLQALEKAMEKYPHVTQAHAYTYMNEKNHTTVAGEIFAEKLVSEQEILEYLKENLTGTALPTKLIIKDAVTGQVLV